MRPDSIPLAHRRALLLLGLCGVALLAVCGSSSGATVASIVSEAGSTAAFANDTITIDGSLGGPHAGTIFVANNSRVTLFNVTVVFVNDTAGGGIDLRSGGRLEVDGSDLSSLSTARFVISMTGGSSLRINRSNVTGLQATEDIQAPGIVMDGGSSLRVEGSVVRVRPDLRPLLEATQSDATIIGCNLTGALRFFQSSATLTLLVQTLIGESTAVDASGSTVTLSNSTVRATGGGSAVSAASGSSVTVRSTNLSAEDIGVAAVSSSTVTLSGVIVEAGNDLGTTVGAFGLAADGATVVGNNVAFIGFTTSLWLRNSGATLSTAQLGTGLLRVNSSTAFIEDAPMIQGVIFLERASTLTLTDTPVNWARIDLVPGSTVVPRYRHTLQFFTPPEVPASNVSWTVYPDSGLAVGSGVSDGGGRSRSPPLEGPRYTSSGFQAPPIYRIQYAGTAGSFNDTITAWEPGLAFSFYMDAALPEAGFAGPLVLSDLHPPRGATFTASASLALSGGTATSVWVRLLIDGADSTVRSYALTPGTPVLVEFTLNSTDGLHLVALRLDGESGPRGALNERSEGANNRVAMLYNASANVTSSVKPDLVVAAGGITFTYLNATAPDPVTGGPRDARQIVIVINISNTGLTAAGPFDVSVAVGVDARRSSVAGVPPGGSTSLSMTFGPYLESSTIDVLVQLDPLEAIDEGSEINNGATATASVVVPPYRPPPREAWVTALVIGAAIAVLLLSAWGVMLIFREDKDDSFVPPTDTKPPEPAKAPVGPAAAAAPAAPAAQSALPAPQAAPPQGAPPPLASPPRAPAPYQPPVQQPMYPAPPMQQPYGWQMPAYGPPPMGYPYAPPAPYPPPRGPPSTCPRCGSNKLSYILQPMREAVCTVCQTRTPF